MGATPDKLSDPTSTAPQEIPHLDSQGGMSPRETTPLSEGIDEAGRDDRAIQSAREKREQLERDENTRRFMETSKIKQKIVPLNPDDIKPAELPPFLQQAKQPAQGPGPNVLQKFLRKILGIKN